jgi:pimeloyl-ACP methyl ester carboxylesterase
MTRSFSNSMFQTVDELSLHTRLWLPDGSVRGKVLLVHGLGGGTFSWEATWPALCQAGYATLAVDLPGFGWSSRRRGTDHSQKARAQLLWHLLQAIDQTSAAGLPGEPWHLVGHSMGGGAVAAMALAQPARTASLVWVDGALFPLFSHLWSRLCRFLPLAWLLAAGIRLICFNAFFVRRALRTAMGEEPSRNQVLTYLQPLCQPGTASVLVDMVRTLTFDDAGRLRELPVAVSAIWGGRDAWIPLSEAQRQKALLPGLDLRVIGEAGHMPMETHAERFNELLLSLLN